MVARSRRTYPKRRVRGVKRTQRGKGIRRKKRKASALVDADDEQTMPQEEEKEVRR